MKFLSFPVGRRCRPQMPHKNAASQTIYDEGSEEDMQIERVHDKAGKSFTQSALRKSTEVTETP
jgi:hypothetical protein